MIFPQECPTCKQHTFCNLCEGDLEENVLFNSHDGYSQIRSLGQDSAIVQSHSGETGRLPSATIHILEHTPSSKPTLDELAEGTESFYMPKLMQYLDLEELTHLLSSDLTNTTI